MRYMLLIYSDESRYAKLTQEETVALMEDYGRFTAGLQEAGALVGAERLHPTPTATTVTVRKGDTITTDGPFAETKEQLGGYYIIDVQDLDAALHWAAQVPTAKYGRVEVRPIWESENE